MTLVLNLRLEFTRKTKALAFARSQGRCECGKCGGIRLVPGKFQYHHIKEANDGGDNSVENCLVITNDCHKPLTAHYVKETRKHERIRDKNIGAMGKTSRPIQSAGFGSAKPQKKASGKLNKWAAWRDGSEI